MRRIVYNYYPLAGVSSDLAVLMRVLVHLSRPPGIFSGFVDFPENREG